MQRTTASPARCGISNNAKLPVCSYSAFTSCKPIGRFSFWSVVSYGAAVGGS